MNERAYATRSASDIAVRSGRFTRAASAIRLLSSIVGQSVVLSTQPTRSPIRAPAASLWSSGWAT